MVHPVAHLGDNPAKRCSWSSQKESTLGAMPTLRHNMMYLWSMELNRPVLAIEKMLAMGWHVRSRQTS
jgi:hypothetical protein